MENELQNLGNLSKERLIEIILSVNEKNEKLKDDYQKIINLRLYHLERDLNMSLQYSRRDTIEITGIPPVIEDQDLEKSLKFFVMRRLWLTSSRSKQVTSKLVTD